jgi:hypothetical protein
MSEPREESVPELIARAHALGLPSTLVHEALDREGVEWLRQLLAENPQTESRDLEER